MCENMSTTPAEICSAGSVAKRAGLMKAARGRMSGEPIPILSPWCVMTARVDCSEPAAGIESTAKTGSAFSGTASPVKKSQLSPSYSTPIATALAVSITEPPPTATTALIA